MNLVISKCVTAVKVSNFTNHSTLDIGVLGYISILQHKEHPPKVWSVPPVTPCILLRLFWYVFLSLVFIISDQNIIHTCTRCLRSHMPDLLIDTFHYVCILWLGMTLHDLTTLCGNAHLTKLQWANTQSHVFLLLVVCYVKVGMAIMSS